MTEAREYLWEGPELARGSSHISIFFSLYRFIGCDKCKASLVDNCPGHAAADKCRHGRRRQGLGGRAQADLDLDPQPRRLAAPVGVEMDAMIGAKGGMR